MALQRDRSPSNVTNKMSDEKELTVEGNGAESRSFLSSAP